MDKNFNLQRFIISVVLVGIVLVIGIYITSEIGEVSMDTNVPGSVANETITGLNDTVADSFTVSTLKDVVCSISTVLNATSNTTILSGGNWTASGCGILGVAESPYLGENVKVTYTYTYTAATSASNASDNVTAALATGTSWISILVVVGFAVIILTMLTSGLGSAARGTEATPYY